MEQQIELQILKTKRSQYLRGTLLAIGVVSILFIATLAIDTYMTDPLTNEDLNNEHKLPTEDHQSPIDNKTEDGGDHLDRISLLAAQVEKNYETAVYMRVNFNYTRIINETTPAGWNKDIHLTRINATTWTAHVWFANFSEGYPDDLRIYNYTAFYHDSDIQQINRLITDGVNETEDVDWDWSSWDQNAGGGNMAYFFDIFYENGTGIEFHINGNFAGEGVVIFSEFNWETLETYPWGDFPILEIAFPYEPLYLSPVTAFDNVVAKVHELFSESPPG